MKRLFLLLLPALLGGLVLLRWVDGTLIYYVAARYIWLVAGGAVFLVCLGAVGTFFSHAVSHTKAAVRPWQMVFLAVPILLGFTLSPRPLSANTALQRGLGQALPTYLTPQPFSFAVDSSQRTFGDWARILFSSAEKSSLIGKQANISGFITKEGSDVYLTRFQVSCCAADGRPVGILLQPNMPVETNTWWKVSGEMEKTETGEIRLKAKEMTPIDIPANPYL